MILLVVFGGLIFVLGCFYLVNSWQQYHQWKFATLLVLVSLAVTVYGVINLPYWHKNSSAQTSSQTSAKSSSSGTSSNSISGYSNNPRFVLFDGQHDPGTKRSRRFKAAPIFLF